MYADGKERSWKGNWKERRAEGVKNEGVYTVIQYFIK